MKITTLAQAVEILQSYAPPAAAMKDNYSLDLMRQLLASLGNPQELFPAIHIAGTSGKTSTAYFVRGLLQAAGARTGLTVSPHIVDVAERLQLAGYPVSMPQFLGYLNDFLPRVEQTGLKPSYFVLLVALAYTVFAEAEVDYAVIETGLGGLFDATNTIRRPDKLCVISDIGLDHTEILGDTVAEIAAQKAGIIQPGNHVILQAQDPVAMQVIEAAAARQGATLEVVTAPATGYSLPPFQERNFALALAAYHYLADRGGLPGLTATQLAAVARQAPPGRMEIYQVGEKTVILDGAHNAQKLEALHAALTARGLARLPVLANFVAAPPAKITAALAALAPFTSRLIVPDFAVGQDLGGRRSVPAAELVTQATQVGSSAQAEPDLTQAIQILLADPAPVVLVTGSLYLVSLVRPIIEG